MLLHSLKSLKDSLNLVDILIVLVVLVAGLQMTFIKIDLMLVVGYK